MAKLHTTVLTIPMGKAAGHAPRYVVHDDVAGDLSPDLFSVNEVHKIGILDIRCVNTDRNEGNILVRHGRTRRSMKERTVSPIHCQNGDKLKGLLKI